MNCRLFSCLVLVMLGLAAHNLRAGEDQKPTAAFIDVSHSRVGPLLEQKLLQCETTAWLERNQIDDLLRERKLVSLMAPEAGPQRTTVGRLLKADLLVLLRHSETPKEHVQVVVCETKRGLRLAVHPVVLSAKVEEDVQRLLSLVEGAIAKYGQEIREICAVPPFVSHDLTYEYGHLQGAYAKLVEQVLLDRPGVLVVELVEARAVGRELALSNAADRLRRPLPLYLLGEFRHHEKDDRRQVHLQLQILRGREKLAQQTTDLDSDKAPEFLRKTAAELIEQTAGVKRKLPDPAQEARRLVDRAALFEQLGQWEEAADLIEAALLLQNDKQFHQQAVDAHYQLTREYFYNVRRSWQERVRGLEYYLRGLEHLEEFLRTTGDVNGTRPKAPGGAIPFYIRSLRAAMRSNQPEELMSHLKEAAEREREILVRILRSRTYSGYRIEFKVFNALCQALPKKEQFDLAYQFLVEFQDRPQLEERILRYALRTDTAEVLNSPEGEAFLSRLERSENPKFHSGAESLRKEAAAAVARRQRITEVVGPNPVPDSQPVKFTPIQFPAVNEKGDKLTLTHFVSYISAGPQTEIAWDRYHLCAISREGPWKVLWSSYERFLSLKRAVFDGRYVWVTVSRYPKPPLLLFVDPQSGAVSEITEEDGLPWEESEDVPMRSMQRLGVSAVSPGRVCVAGWFGRSWIALVTVDPDRVRPVTVEVIHEARRTGARNGPEQWKDPHLVFRPAYMLTLADKPLADPEAQRRVLVGRSSTVAGVAEYPLLVDPKARRVSVMQPGFNFGLFDGRPTNPSRFASSRGVVYCILPTRDFQRRHLYRLGFPELEPVVFLPDVPEGWLVFDRDHLHVVGRKWWRVREDGKRVDVLGDVPWYYHTGRLKRPGRNALRLCEICNSRRYGLLAVTQKVAGPLTNDQWTTFQVTIDDPKEADSK